MKYLKSHLIPKFHIVWQEVIDTTVSTSKVSTAIKPSQVATVSSLLYINPIIDVSERSCQILQMIKTIILAKCFSCFVKTHWPIWMIKNKSNTSINICTLMMVIWWSVLSNAKLFIVILRLVAVVVIVAARMTTVYEITACISCKQETPTVKNTGQPTSEMLYKLKDISV